MQLRRKAILISALLPLLSTASVLLTHYVIRKHETGKTKKSFLFQVGPYCYLDTLTYMMGAYWYLACEMLSGTARVMADHFQKVFHCYLAC